LRATGVEQCSSYDLYGVRISCGPMDVIDAAGILETPWLDLKNYE